MSEKDPFFSKSSTYNLFGLLFDLVNFLENYGEAGLVDSISENKKKDKLLRDPSADTTSYGFKRKLLLPVANSYSSLISFLGSLQSKDEALYTLDICIKTIQLNPDAPNTFKLLNQVLEAIAEDKLDISTFLRQTQ